MADQAEDNVLVMFLAEIRAKLTIITDYLAARDPAFSFTMDRRFPKCSRSTSARRLKIWTSTVRWSENRGRCATQPWMSWSSKPVVRIAAGYCASCGPKRLTRPIPIRPHPSDDLDRAMCAVRRHAARPNTSSSSVALHRSAMDRRTAWRFSGDT